MTQLGPIRAWLVTTRAELELEFLVRLVNKPAQAWLVYDPTTNKLSTFGFG